MKYLIVIIGIVCMASAVTMQDIKTTPATPKSTVVFESYVVNIPHTIRYYAKQGYITKSMTGDFHGVIVVMEKY